jgi:hypothetical protein
MTDVRQAMFPYGMAQNPDGSWTFFNRKYKPLGVVASEHAEWDDPRHKIRLKGLSRAVLAKLDHKGVGSGERIYFNDDASNPARSASIWVRYAERLKLLTSLKVDEI